MAIQQQAFFHQPTSTVTYLVWDEATRAAAIIDPVLDYAPASAKVSHDFADGLLAAVRSRGLDLRYVLETHAHADHLSAADYLRRATGGTVVMGEGTGGVQSHFAAMFEADDVTPDGSAFGRLVADGDQLPLGRSTISVMHTPGHTAACVTYLVDGHAYAGDTLFMPTTARRGPTSPAGTPRPCTGPSSAFSPCPRKPASLSGTTTCPRAARPSPGKRPWPSRRRTTSTSTTGSTRPPLSPDARPGTQRWRRPR